MFRHLSMITKYDPIMKSTFICPRCNNETEINDGIIRVIEVSSEKDNRYGYDPYYSRIITKYYISV